MKAYGPKIRLLPYAAIKGERRLRNTPILRRSDSPEGIQRSFGVYNQAVHFGLSGEQARKAPVCAPFVSTALVGELVPQAQSTGH